MYFKKLEVCGNEIFKSFTFATSSIYHTQLLFLEGGNSAVFYLKYDVA